VARSIYITSAEGHSGKSTIALGVLDALSRATPKVGVFRPIARSTKERDYVLELLLEHDGVDLEYEECVAVTYDDVRADPEGALATIVARFQAVQAKCDAVVVLGSDYTDVGSPAELAYNARIAVNLGTPVLLVLGGRAQQGHSEQLGTTAPRTPDEVAQIAALALPEIARERAELLAAVVNRADADHLDAVTEAVRVVLHDGGRAARRRRPAREGRRGAAHPRGAGRRDRGHVDGERAAPAHGGRVPHRPR
jgi:phosphate acetyltransferase